MKFGMFQHKTVSFPVADHELLWACAPVLPQFDT